jgi:hypothetical protein
MTATTVERLPKYAGPYAGKGTHGIAENTLLLKGTIVTQDSAGRAAVPAAGQPAIGVASATYDNRTTSDLGGAADAKDAEVQYGVFGWAYTGTAPKPRQIVYVVDNQTVSLDPTGNRGIAGVVTEVRDSLAYVFMGPHASAFASADVADVDLPIGNFRLSTGAAIPAFNADVADGFTIADSEGFGIRINDDSTTVFVASARLPEVVPVGATVTLHILASRIGAADTTASLTPHVFANREGVAYDSLGDLVTGDFAAISGATKVVQEVTKAITGALGGDVLTVTLQATAALDDDDMMIHAVWISVR